MTASQTLGVTLHTLFSSVQLPGLDRQQLIRNANRNAEHFILNPKDLFGFQYFCGEFETFLDVYLFSLSLASMAV